MPTEEEKKALTVEELAAKGDSVAKYIVENEARRRREEEPPLRTDRGNDDDDDDGRGRRQSRRSGGGGNPLIQIGVISAIVAAVVMMVMSSMGLLPFVSKADFTKNVQGIIATIDKNKMDLSATVEGLRVAVNNIPNTVTTQVNNVMSQTVNQFNAQVKTVTDQYNPLAASVSAIDKKTTDNNMALQTKIDALTKTESDQQKVLTDQKIANDATIKALQDRIVALEAKTITPPTVAKSVTAKIKQMSSALLPINDTTLSAGIKVTLTNNTNVAVEDIILEIAVATDVITGYASSTLTGAGTVWQGQGVPWNQKSFMNTQWGLNLAANETKTLYLTFTVTGVVGSTYMTTYVNGVALDVSVSVG